MSRSHSMFKKLALSGYKSRCNKCQETEFIQDMLSVISGKKLEFMNKKITGKYPYVWK